METDKVLVIGGGASGMMAAVAAADQGAQVCIIEKNEKLGKKLFITGKGRCNVTNAADMETLFENVCTNSKFLYSAFYDFDNMALMEWLRLAGCPLKTERGGRVFPVSDHSSDVIAAFCRELKKRGVEILLNTEVTDILVEESEEADKPEEAEKPKGAEKAENTEKLKGAENAEEAETDAGKKDSSFRKGNSMRRDSSKRKGGSAKKITGVSLSDGRIVGADRVIVCTGGLSYPATGSTGDGYRFARSAGHTVTECSPSLVPFHVKESWCGELMGLTLRNVEARLMEGGREVYRGFGELLFTHFGVSGPLVLSASSYYRRKGRKSGESVSEEPTSGEAMLYIDLKPAMDPELLDRRLLRDFEENKNRQFKNALGELFPAKLIPVMVRLSGIKPEKMVNEITREERRDFAALIKKLTLSVTGTRGYAEAVITRGGVSVREINPSTMESRKVKGLYFAGEVLDLDALTGGFNLQIAWSTGHLSGKCSVLTETQR